MALPHSHQQNETSKPQTMEVVEHFFRREHGKIVASFASKYGFDHIEIIEDSVQDAFIRAMQVWPYHRVPENPSAWIFKVANNQLIDKLRREKKISRIKINQVEIKILDQSEAFQMPEDNEIEDDQLNMIFTCCHPVLSVETQIILTLNLLCGLGTAEIARALMKNKEAIAKALTRGKHKFKKEVGSLHPPGKDKLPQRLSVVLKIIYLLFNEGYRVTKGDQLMNHTLTSEAIRLGILLIRRYSAYHELNALMALMYFQASRFKARCDESGNLLSMKEQDRSLWDQELINIGRQYLAYSAGGRFLSDYHIQAGIASLHCAATTFEDTDWVEMLKLYDLQVSFNRLPIAEMNRVVPLSRIKGPMVGLDEIKRLRKYPQLLKNHLYYAIKAELLKETGNTSKALKALEIALLYVTNATERRFLEKKMSMLKP